MKKLLTVCLILSLTFGIFGCGTAPTDETLITRAKELLPKTEELNDLLYITGIPLDPTAKETNGYQKADGEYLKEKGITKISDVFSKMKGIWSEDYIERFKKSSLVTSVVEGNQIAAYAYCYDQYDKLGNFLSIMVSTQGLPIQCGAVEYLYDTLEVKEKTGEHAVLSLSVNVTNGEGQTKETTLSVTLTKNEMGEWLLGSTTAVVYPKDSYPLPL